MSTTLTATFDTRRDADMTVERMVQELGVDRAAIFVAAEGDENSAGEERAGSDERAGEPSPPPRSDAALKGGVVVSVDLDDDATADRVRDAFGEFDAAGVVEIQPSKD